MPFQFSHVCQLLTDLEGVVTRDPPYMTKIRDEELKRKLDYWFRCHRRSIDLGDVDGVALLSTLLPEKRTDRVYGLQEARLCKVIGRCLRLSKGNAKVLQRWRIPGHGGLGSCVQKVLREFDCERKPGAFVTVEEVDTALHNLASRCRFSGPTVRPSDNSTTANEQLEQLYRRMSSDEAKWFTRLILKNYSPVQIDYDHVISEFHFLLPGLLRFQDSFTAAIALLRTALGHYPSKPDLDMQRMARVEASTLLSPAIGVKVGRQTFVKARSMQHCVSLCGSQVWSAERKYDGEYCEIHIDLSKGEDCIQIFSKSTKDSTEDRRALHDTLRETLRIGTRRCAFQSRCIVTGELVVWSDKRERILEFYHLRKHVSRSGVYLGRDEDSQIEPGEHLMIVFFDILLLDDENLLRKPYAERRQRLKEVIRCRVGHAITSERAIINFRRLKEAQSQLCYQFAAAIMNRCEGLVLKPLDMPYFRFEGDGEGISKGFVIKLKKDYLQELGELRDVADFAVIGGSYDPNLVHKSGIHNIQFTTFHLGCCVNKDVSIRFGERPRFRIMGTITLDQCIPRNELQALNSYFTFRQVPAFPLDGPELNSSAFDLERTRENATKIDCLLTEPCVVEVLGSGFERPPNTDYQMLRHPRILKLHLDRGWHDACTFEELQLLAEEARQLPEENESQEMSELVKKLEGKFKRKAERERSTQTSTQRSEPFSSSGTLDSAKRTTTLTVPSPVVRRRTARATMTPVMIRIDTNERLPGEPEMVSSEPPANVNNRSKEMKLLPTPPTSSAPALPPNRSVQKRSAPCPPGEHDVKRRKHIESEKTAAPGIIALSPINSNIMPRQPTRVQESHAARQHEGSTGSHSRVRQPVDHRPLTCAAPLCSSDSCPFSRSVIYLSSCVQGFRWVSDTLLKWHGAEQVSTLSHWDRRTNSQPPDYEIPESMSFNGYQKLVLVESNRLDATLQCVDSVKRLGIREPVLFFDWRVLEDWWTAESKEGHVEAQHQREILQNRFFGFTCWSTDKVVFWHRDLVQMPTDWLEI